MTSLVLRTKFFALIIAVAFPGCAKDPIGDLYDKVQVGAPADEAILNVHMKKSALGWTYDNIQVQSKPGQMNSLRIVTDGGQVIAKKYVRYNTTYYGFLKSIDVNSVTEVEIPAEYFHAPDADWNLENSIFNTSPEFKSSQKYLLDVLGLWLWASNIEIKEERGKTSLATSQSVSLPTSLATSKPAQSVDTFQNDTLDFADAFFFSPSLDYKAAIRAVLGITHDHPLARLHRMFDKPGMPTSWPTTEKSEKLLAIANIKKCTPLYLAAINDIMWMQNPQLNQDVLVLVNQNSADAGKQLAKCISSVSLIVMLGMAERSLLVESASNIGAEISFSGHTETGATKTATIKQIGERTFRIEMKISKSDFSFFGLEDKNK